MILPQISHSENDISKKGMEGAIAFDFLIVLC